MVARAKRFRNMMLTRKQQCFVNEYLLDMNATQAAIRSGYSKKTSKQIGTENLSKPAISAAIMAAMQCRSDKARVDSDWVLSNAVGLYRESRTNGNLRNALTALTLIGKHVNVQAFKDRVDVSKVDHAAILEELIADCCD